MNNVPIAVSCTKNNPLDILIETKSIINESLERSHVPLDIIARETSSAGKSLYDIMFMYQNQTNGYSLNFEGHSIQEYKIRYNPAYCDITFNLVPENKRLIINISYNESLYTESKIIELMNSYIATTNKFIGLLEKA